MNGPKRRAVWVNVPESIPRPSTLVCRLQRGLGPDDPIVNSGGAADFPEGFFGMRRRFMAGGPYSSKEPRRIIVHVLEDDGGEEGRALAEALAAFGIHPR